MISTHDFEKAVSDYYEPLFRFAMCLARSKPDACDLTQHTFYVLAKKGDQLRDVSKLKSWLFTTLHRAFLETRRKQHRFSEHESKETVAEELPTVPPGQFSQADSSEVLAALAKVDLKQQAAVALFYLEDYAYKEIAAILAVPIGTVKSRIARGIAQLREILLSDGSTSKRRHAKRGFRPTLRAEPVGTF